MSTKRSDSDQGNERAAGQAPEQASQGEAGAQAGVPTDERSTPPQAGQPMEGHSHPRGAAQVTGGRTTSNQGPAYAAAGRYGPATAREDTRRPSGGAAGPRNPTASGLQGADTDDMRGEQNGTMPVAAGLDDEGHRPDPGPPPSRPVYTGDRATSVVDMLTLAMEADDRDAVQSVVVRGEVPQVAQYKANILQWLDDMERYRNTSHMPQGQPRKATEDDDRAQQEADAREQERLQQQEQDQLRAQQRNEADRDKSQR